MSKKLICVSEQQVATIYLKRLKMLAIGPGSVWEKGVTKKTKLTCFSLRFNTKEGTTSHPYKIL